MAEENVDDGTIDLDNPAPAGGDADESGNVAATAAETTGREAGKVAGEDEAGAAAAAQPTLEDAINAALETAPGQPKKVEKTDEELEAEAESKGQVRDLVTGKFRAKTDEEKAQDGTAAAAKPGEKKDEAAAATKAEKAVADPIPANLKAETRERMQTLIDTVKEKDVTLSGYRELIDSIADTGVNEDEFANMLGYQRLVHSEDPAHWDIAYKVIQQELRGLAVKMGKDLPEVDFLSGFQDLKDQVSKGEVTETVAREAARLRYERNTATKQKETVKQTEKQQTDARAAHQAAVTQGIKELDDLGAELEAAEPDVYARKYDILIPMLEPVFATLPPAQWKAAFKKAYDAMKVTRTAPVPTPTPRPAAGGTPPAKKPAAPQPLRPKQPSGNAEGAPKSVQDAVFGALKEMGV